MLRLRCDVYISDWSIWLTVCGQAHVELTSGSRLRIFLRSYAPLRVQRLHSPAELLYEMSVWLVEYFQELSEAEQQYRTLQQQHLNQLQLALEDKDKQLTEGRALFDKLKQDFKYNLRLLQVSWWWLIANYEEI